MEETLTVHRLHVPMQLRKTLASTNVIESAFSIVEQVAFVNLIWPLLMLSFGPTWPLFRLPSQTQFLDPLP